MGGRHPRRHHTGISREGRCVASRRPPLLGRLPLPISHCLSAMSAFCFLSTCVPVCVPVRASARPCRASVLAVREACIFKNSYQPICECETVSVRFRARTSFRIFFLNNKAVNEPLIDQRTALGGIFRGVPVLVPVRASPVPSVVRGSLVLKFFSKHGCL